MVGISVDSSVLTEGTLLEEEGNRVLAATAYT